MQCRDALSLTSTSRVDHVTLYDCANFDSLWPRYRRQQMKSLDPRGSLQQESSIGT